MNVVNFANLFQPNSIFQQNRLGQGPAQPPAIDALNRLSKNMSSPQDRAKERKARFDTVELSAVIILDEPTVGLDPIQIIEIRDLIRQLGETHTVILSSHILSEVQAICEKVLIISQGKLVAFDRPENLEKLLLASNGISFTAEASEEEIGEVLGGISHIAEWEIQVQEDGGTKVFARTESENVKDICRELFFAFADRKKAILEISSRKANLEDVFIELTEGESGVAEE